jgi:hypothetical protein
MVHHPSTRQNLMMAVTDLLDAKKNTLTRNTHTHNVLVHTYNFLGVCEAHYST